MNYKTTKKAVIFILVLALSLSIGAAAFANPAYEDYETYGIVTDDTFVLENETLYAEPDIPTEELLCEESFDVVSEEIFSEAAIPTITRVTVNPQTALQVPRGATSVASSNYADQYIANLLRTPT